MPNYKIEFVTTQSHVIDVKAQNEEEAKSLARKHFEEKKKNGTLHYYEYGDPETTINYVHDVTNTDDPFNPEN